MSESNPPESPATYSLGANYRPAPASVPLLRASLPLAQPPQECRWDRDLDLTGDDGRPDALGNDEPGNGNCVPVAALRLMQSITMDGRKPTRNYAMALLRAWGGTPEGGTYTDEAFSFWASKGYRWGDRQIVPRWTLIERDGVMPDLGRVKQAIHALGGVIAVFDMPQSALTINPWTMPASGGSVGHHAVAVLGYDTTGFYGISWGHVVTIGYAFMIARVRQVSAFASDAWVHAVGDGTARTPSGLTAEQIRAVGADVAGV